MQRVGRKAPDTIPAAQLGLPESQQLPGVVPEDLRLYISRKLELVQYFKLVHLLTGRQIVASKKKTVRILDTEGPSKFRVTAECVGSAASR